MNTKLTLNIEEQIIDRAKDYAYTHNISLSKLIENYLQKITADSKEENKITPLVKSLSGIIDLPKEFNYKDAYGDFLTEKYK